ncbi:MAG: hypothetical protein ABEJ86_07315 [Halococcoides sp.]
MHFTDFPLVDHVVSFGPDSRIFDALLISGPLVIVAIALFGRNPVTIGLAGAYLLLFVASVGIEAIARRRDAPPENART